MRKMSFESDMRTFPSPESDSWLTSRPFISVEATIGVGTLKPISQRTSRKQRITNVITPFGNANTIRTSRTRLHLFADERGGAIHRTHHGNAVYVCVDMCG